MSRLKPAHKIYERLLWDQECLPGAKFVIGYEDRFLGIMEVTREEFEASGDIPFHRVRYFKAAETGQHVWDREKRIDLITRTYANSSSDSNKNSCEQQQPRTVPVFSTKSKKNYLKRRRKKYRLRELNEARQQLKDEERIEAEHNQMYEDKMREVEERILRFQQLKTSI